MKMTRMVSAGVLLLSSSAALAGAEQPQPVIVQLNADGSGSALGDMVTARASKNDLEMIGCGIRSFADSGVIVGFCQAVDAGGVAVSCFVEDPVSIEALQALNSYSFITFSWDADGRCRTVGNSTQSLYVPPK